MTTIQDIEIQTAEKLGRLLRELGLLQPGYRPVVRLSGENRDKRRTADFAKNWSPDSDSIRIVFEPSGEIAEAPFQPAETQSTRDVSGDATRELLAALGRAEARPGYDFISLKWFRDTALPTDGFPWASDVAARQSVLADAIERRLI